MSKTNCSNYRVHGNVKIGFEKYLRSTERLAKMYQDLAYQAKC